MGRRGSTGAWWRTLCNGANSTTYNSTPLRPRRWWYDFQRTKRAPLPVSIEGVNVEVVSTYKYLGVHLDNKLDWSANTDAVYKKGQSRLYFLRRLWSFNVCSKLLGMFYQSVVASVPLLCSGVLGPGSTKKRDAGQLDRLVRKAGSVVGAELESITSVARKKNSEQTAHHHGQWISSTPQHHHPAEERDQLQATEHWHAKLTDWINHFFPGPFTCTIHLYNSSIKVFKRVRLCIIHPLNQIHPLCHYHYHYHVIIITLSSLLH